MITETRANIVILTHVLHRIGEFFDEYPPARFTDEREIGAAFIVWLCRKDAPPPIQLYPSQSREP